MAGDGQAHGRPLTGDILQLLQDIFRRDTGKDTAIDVGGNMLGQGILRMAAIDHRGDAGRADLADIFGLLGEPGVCGRVGRIFRKPGHGFA